MTLLTIFTPTYNRAHTLARTYQSLCQQNCKDFIWLIIDDGSIDKTAELVKKWKQLDNGFEIQYVYKENGGMHTAHNVAYEKINTELNMCIDSDDCLAEGAIEKIKTKWEKIKNKNYAGIISLDADFKGKVIGKDFPEGMKETTLGGYYAGGGDGDKKLIYRTDVIKNTPPYPVFTGEKYVALAYKYRLIDQNYKMSVLNEIICNVDYQPDGSSGTMLKQYLKSPKGFAFWRKVCMNYPISTKRLILDCIHYCSSSILAHNKQYILESPKKALTVICTPAGWLLTIYIKKKLCKEN